MSECVLLQIFRGQNKQDEMFFVDLCGCWYGDNRERVGRILRRYIVSLGRKKKETFTQKISNQPNQISVSEKQTNKQAGRQKNRCHGLMEDFEFNLSFFQIEFYFCVKPQI